MKAYDHHKYFKNQINDAWNDCECSSISYDVDENVKLKYIKRRNMWGEIISFQQMLKTLFKFQIRWVDVLKTTSIYGKKYQRGNSLVSSQMLSSRKTL